MARGGGLRRKRSVAPPNTTIFHNYTADNAITSARISEVPHTTEYVPKRPMVSLPMHVNASYNMVAQQGVAPPPPPQFVPTQTMLTKELPPRATLPGLSHPVAVSDGTGDAHLPPPAVKTSTAKGLTALHLSTRYTYHSSEYLQTDVRMFGMPDSPAYFLQDPAAHEHVVPFLLYWHADSGSYMFWHPYRKLWFDEPAGLHSEEWHPDPIITRIDQVEEDPSESLPAKRQHVAADDAAGRTHKDATLKTAKRQEAVDHASPKASSPGPASSAADSPLEGEESCSPSSVGSPPISPSKPVESDLNVYATTIDTALLKPSLAPSLVSYDSEDATSDTPEAEETPDCASPQASSSGPVSSIVDSPDQENQSPASVDSALFVPPKILEFLHDDLAVDLDIPTFDPSWRLDFNPDDFADDIPASPPLTEDVVSDEDIKVMSEFVNFDH